MTSSFIYYFDVASIFVFAVILVTYFQQHFIKDASHYTFLFLWWTASMTPFFDIASVIALECEASTLFSLLNGIYYLTQQYSAFAFFLYALSPLARRKNMKFYKQGIFIFPITAITVLVLTNPFTGWLYSYDVSTNVYSHGPLQFTCYIATLAYYLYSVYFVLRYKEIYNKHVCLAISNTLLIVFAGIAVQYIFPQLLLHSFAISLAFMQLLCIMLKKGNIIDRETKLVSKNAFYEKITFLLYNKISFNVLAIRIADYDLLVDTYGLDTAVKLHSILGRKISAIAPKSSAYRLHDDMFAIIARNQSAKSNKEMLEKLDSLSKLKIEIENVDVSFSHFVASFNYPENFQDMTQLLNLISYMHKMHKLRYGIMPIEEFSIRDLTREKSVENAVANALNDGTLEVFYQPIYDTKKKKIVSCEALSRINHSPLGYISPGEFIPIAERTGLMIKIGDYVLEKVFKFIKEHDLEKLGIEYIELNLSTVQCLQRNFFVNLMSLVHKYDINPKYVCFEITETASSCAPEIFTQNLICLHNEGFLLAIDDFGSGYANLQRLCSMDFDVVKFDNETTKKINHDPKLKPIFEKMVSMFHSMGVEIVSEGVEEKEELDYLTDIQVDFIQGFYFSKAINEEDFVKYIESMM